MHIIDLKLHESFRERKRHEKQEQTIYFFMSLSRSLISQQDAKLIFKAQLLPFPPRFLTAMQCYTDSKDWHKVIFDQNCQ